MVAVGAGEVGWEDLSQEERYHKYVVPNLRLAYKVAQRFKYQTPDEHEELKSAAVYGLLYAVERYDPSKGLKFSTYAWHWCRHYAGQAYRVLRAPITTSEIKYNVETLDVSQPGAYEQKARTESPEEELINEASVSGVMADVLKEMEDIGSRERMVLILYYGLGCEAMNTTEISRVMGFSRQAGHQNLQRGMRRLKRAMRRRYPNLKMEDI